MNRVDQSAAFRASGRSLVSDHPAHFTAPPVTADVALVEGDLVPAGLKVWAARSSYPFHVQGLVDDEGACYVTCVLDGRCETREVDPAVAFEAFEHPFAHGFTLPL